MSEVSRDGSLEAAGGARPVRDAATVLVVRPAPSGRVEFHALRRPVTLRAFAGFWAFPGGSVEPEDREPAWEPMLFPLDAARATEIAIRREGSDPAIETRRFRRRMRDVVERFIGKPLPDDPIPDPGAAPASNLAVWVTAVREVFEETGILLARGSTAQPGGTQPTEGALHAMRASLRAGERPFLALLSEAGLQPDVAALRYMGRLLTPSTEARRFDTRFFLGRASESFVDRLGDAAGEVAEAGWFDPAEALQRHAAGGFPLAPPSRFALETIAGYRSCAELWAAFG